MAKNRERRSGVLGWPPDSVAGDTHGSETKTVNGQFTAQRDSSTGTCERTSCFFVHILSPKYRLTRPERATILATEKNCRVFLRGRPVKGATARAEAVPMAKSRIPMSGPIALLRSYCC